MATTRYIFIEKILRAVYGEQPHDDSNITFNLANVWLNEGIGIAAKQNYKDNNLEEFKCRSLYCIRDTLFTS